MSGNFSSFVGWWLGLENVSELSWPPNFSLAAPWVQGSGLFWLFLLIVAFISLSVGFYVAFQRRGPFYARVGLMIARAVLLALLLLTLADPVLTLTTTTYQQPYLYVVFDGTDSMAIEDNYDAAIAEKLAAAIGESSSESVTNVSRMDYVKKVIGKKEENLLNELEAKDYRVEAYLFDGNSTSRLRKLNMRDGSNETIDPTLVAGQLTTDGKVTAIGNVITDVNQQLGARYLAGVVFVSDFAHNSGVAPISARGGETDSPLSSLKVPVYTVGVGALEARNLAVDVQTDPKMKRAERSTVYVKVRQSGLEGEPARVTLTAKPLRGKSDAFHVYSETKTITLGPAVDNISFPFTPEEAGRFEFEASVEPLPGEMLTDDNVAAREVNIIDDYLRLMYVAYEPTWEWRFVKEVFHRDKLVGLEGFRTYLSSSDPQVRESNILFQPSLTPPRSDFFANDVIFLGDMPGGGLTPRYTEMVKEFVSRFGGGLVVICGPRFGPKELEGTPLADMLPVYLDPNGQFRDDKEFVPRLTPYAAQYPFMQLGDSNEENEKAWNNMGKLLWYQPVLNVHSQARVLMEHPTDTCADGKTPQPIIAVRKYGAGEVVYIGQNEMWRLRRKYGEQYYRQFWSQLIYRLGMSHALGAEKRFVLRADREDYRAEDTVTLTVEAYDENFEPLTDETHPEGLTAKLEVPSSSGATRDISMPMLREGVFEARFPVYSAGVYTVNVTDPITEEVSQLRFEVGDISVERRKAVRNSLLQDELAKATGGKSYDLTQVSDLVGDLNDPLIKEEFTRTRSLWNTPFWFTLLVSLMLGEWFFRKMIHLA